MGLGQFADLRGGLTKKRGRGVFEGETLCIRKEKRRNIIGLNSLPV